MPPLSRQCLPSPPLPFMGQLSPSHKANGELGLSPFPYTVYSSTKEEIFPKHRRRKKKVNGCKECSKTTARCRHQHHKHLSEACPSCTKRWPPLNRQCILLESIQSFHDLCCSLMSNLLCMLAKVKSDPGKDYQRFEIKGKSHILGGGGVHVCVCVVIFAFMYVFTPCECLLLVPTRRKHQIS